MRLSKLSLDESNGSDWLHILFHRKLRTFVVADLSVRNWFAMDSGKKATMVEMEETQSEHALQHLVLQHQYLLSGIAGLSLVAGAPLWMNIKSSISRHRRST